MQIVAIANHKGGCGKTTTSINFSACLAFLQKKVLLIDMDPQGHSTCGLGVDTRKLKYTLYHALSPYETVHLESKDICHEIAPNFKLIPCDESLRRLDEELNDFSHDGLQLTHFINYLNQELTDLDYVVLDCPPNLGILTLNALLAAHELIIPIEPSFFSLHGLAKISETAKNMEGARRSPMLIHALLTLFDSSVRLSEEIYEEVKKHFNEKLFKTIIHNNILLKEAAVYGQSIVQYGPDSEAFREYLNLAVEFLKRQLDRELPEKKLGWQKVLNQKYGPKSVSGGILFQIQAGNASIVEIAGDFNNWIPELLRKSPEGDLWQKIIPVNQKQVRYKFIIDGEWQVDPHHPTLKPNAFGSYDSCLELMGNL